MLTWEGIWKGIGKQPIKTTKNNPEVFIGEDRYKITKIRYESGVPLGFEVEKICCETCKNNVEYPPPHTCDECTSLDSEEFCMWVER